MKLSLVHKFSCLPNCLPDPRLFIKRVSAHLGGLQTSLKLGMCRFIEDKVCNEKLGTRLVLTIVRIEEKLLLCFLSFFSRWCVCWGILTHQRPLSCLKILIIIVFSMVWEHWMVRNINTNQAKEGIKTSYLRPKPKPSQRYPTKSIWFSSRPYNPFIRIKEVHGFKTVSVSSTNWLLLILEALPITRPSGFLEGVFGLSS